MKSNTGASTQPTGKPTSRATASQSKEKVAVPVVVIMKPNTGQPTGKPTRATASQSKEKVAVPFI